MSTTEEKQLPAAIQQAGITDQLMQSWSQLEKMAGVMVQSGFCADAKDLNQAMFKIMYGMELGVGPIAAMTGIFITKQGNVVKPALSANLMAALIKKSPKYRIEFLEQSAQACRIKLWEHGKPAGHWEFTIEDAKQADLLSGPNAHNWRKYPKNMLFARCISNVFRQGCGDLTGGNPTYTPEEQNIVVAEDGDIEESHYEEQEPEFITPLDDAPICTPIQRAEFLEDIKAFGWSKKMIIEELQKRYPGVFDFKRLEESLNARFTVPMRDALRRDIKDEYERMSNDEAFAAATRDVE